jgi:hypothetical protein
MWVYPGSNCPDRPSPKELSVGEVEAQMCKVLDSAIISSPSVGPDTLQRGITSVRVSTLALVSAAFTILSFHYARDLVRGLGDGCDESRDVDPCPLVRGKWNEGWLGLPFFPLHGPSLASRHEFPIGGTLDRRTPTKMPLSKGWVAFRPIRETFFHRVECRGRSL